MEALLLEEVVDLFVDGGNQWRSGGGWVWGIGVEVGRGDGEWRKGQMEGGEGGEGRWAMMITSRIQSS